MHLPILPSEQRSCSNAQSAPVDWSQTELADPAQRPPCLRLTVAIMQNSPLASVLMWGRQQIMLFNQAYVDLLGSRHLRAPGGQVPALRPALWSWNPAAIEAAWQGQAAAFVQQELQVWRDGVHGSHVLDLFYTPIPDGQEQVCGILCTIQPGNTPPLAATPDHAQALRILVVEDNLDAQYLACEMLRAFGYQVMSTDSAELATPLLEAQHFDVLFTDVSLPGLSGIDLARVALRLQPALQVIFASGYGDALTRHLEFPATSIQKPYDLDLLQCTLRAIREKLHAGGV